MVGPGNCNFTKKNSKVYFKTINKKKKTYASHILSEGGGGIFIVTRETKPLKSIPNVMVVLIFSIAFCTNDNSVADWKKLEVAMRSTNLNIRLALPGLVALKKELL